MAAKSKINTFLLFFVMFTGSACALSEKYATEATMINLVEDYRNTFCALGIKQVHIRSNYYICEYNNFSTYIVSCDGQLIRDAHNNLSVISQNALADNGIPECMHKLSLLVINLYTNEVKFLKIESDTIRFETFDDYYLTNRPNNDSLFVEISNGWFKWQK